MLELTRTKELQVTVVPARARLRVQELLDLKGIPYKEIDQDNFEDGWPWGDTYLGVYYSERVFAFITTVTTESLHKAAEDMWPMTITQIRECVVKGDKDDDMLDIHLVRTEEPEVTVVPRKIRLMIRKLLESEGIPYKMVYEFDQNNYQEDWPSIITYNGKIYSDENYAFVTTVTRESLFDAAEKLWLKGPQDIDRWEEEKQKRGE